jgi:ferritin-like metal-binding protein YciE
MTDSLMKQKLIQYFNEALAMENAAVDRNETRMNEMPIPLVRQQLQYHLEQTFVQQDRHKTIITNLGDSPTSSKQGLLCISSFDC